MSRHFTAAVLVFVYFAPAQAQEMPDRAERLGRLPSELIKAKRTDAEILDALFLASLARLPKDHEKENALKHMKAAANRQTICEDVLWTLINTKEFMVMSGMTLEQLLRFGEKVTAAMQKK